MVEHIEDVRTQPQPVALGQRHALGDRRSVLRKLGPITTLRPRVPKRGAATKGDGSNHWSTLPMMEIGPVDVGTDGVRHAVERTVARDDVEGVAALRLDDGRDLPPSGQRMSAGRELVYCAEHESMSGVEIGQTVLAGNVVTVLDGKAGRIE